MDQPPNQKWSSSPNKHHWKPQIWSCSTWTIYWLIFLETSRFDTKNKQCSSQAIMPKGVSYLNVVQIRAWIPQSSHESIVISKEHPSYMKGAFKFRSNMIKRFLSSRLLGILWKFQKISFIRIEKSPLSWWRRNSKVNTSSGSHRKNQTREDRTNKKHTPVWTKSASLTPVQGPSTVVCMIVT